jgi:hypothetical protein
VVLGLGLQELACGVRVADRRLLVEAEDRREVQRVGSADECLVELSADAESFEGGRSADELRGPDFNVAPTKQAPVVIARIPRESSEDADPVRELRSLRLGLLPNYLRGFASGDHRPVARSWSRRHDAAAALIEQGAVSRNRPLTTERCGMRCYTSRAFVRM